MIFKRLNTNTKKKRLNTHEHLNEMIRIFFSLTRYYSRFKFNEENLSTLIKELNSPL